MIAALSAILSPSFSTAACPELTPGELTHNGFFARSNSGLALLWADVKGPGARSAVRGIGQSAAISFGGTPLPGMVLGGSLWTAIIDPSFTEGGVSVTPDDDSVKLTLLRIGPFVDYYPNPTTGFHVLVAAHFAVQLETDVKGNAIEPAGIGPAFSTGTGYEWFISGEFSLGLMANVSLGRLARSPSIGDERMLWFLPELLLAGTYH